jgi:ribosomal protein S27E
MQHPSLTLIIKNPNNTLQLATQPHVKDKLIVKCGKCESTEIVKAGESLEHVCKKCGATKKL